MKPNDTRGYFAVRSLVIRVASILCACLLVLSAIPSTPGMVASASGFARQSLESDHGFGSASDMLSHSVFCLRCSQPYSTLAWDMGYETGRFEPLNNLQFNAIGIDFIFCAADGNSLFMIDVDRVINMLEILDAEIPAQYRRRQVESVVIILSSEMYCLDYEVWTTEQRQELVPDLSSYFTSEKSQQNVLGCCTSFPSTRERQRVIWMTAGKSLKSGSAPREQANCAYSYHLYCSEEIALMAMFIHEMTHALTLTVTMPSLDEYGFSPNYNWELQQLAANREPAELFSVEALAYDTTTRILKKYQPQALFNISAVGEFNDGFGDDIVYASAGTTEVAAAPVIDETQSAQMQLLAEQGAYETLEEIEDQEIPLASDELAYMDSLIAWVLTEHTVEVENSDPWEDYDSEVWEGMDPRGILGAGE